MSEATVWGLDIGGTKCALVIGDRTGKVLARWQVATADYGADWQRLINDLLKNAEGIYTRPLAAGVSCGGPLSSARGVIMSPPNLPGWDAVPAAKILSERTGLPAWLCNDANAGAFAQLWYRSKEYGIRNMIYVLAGQGVGCGMITDGKLVLGHRGLAGEFGHNTINFNGPRCECGNYGCLEKYCSFIVLCENIEKRIRNGESSMLTPAALSTAKISEAVRAGDTVAREEYEKVCGFLAIGIINLINQFNPGLIVIGDELTQVDGERLLSIVQKRVHDCVNPLIYNEIVIELDSMPENPVLMGAAAIAAQQVLSDPGKLMDMPEEK